MLKFIAVDCQHVSDQSILALSQHCPDLDIIDITRTHHAFRISDVCLLAIGQRSASLRILKLSGCDSISDVGMQWLSEGCKALEHLDLHGCEKVNYT